MAEEIYSVYGLKGFFRGNGVNCIKAAPEMGLKMLFFDKLKKLVIEDPKDIKMSERFVSGGIAGAITQTIIYPLEILKTRVALSSNVPIKEVIEGLVQKNGLTAFYRGLSTSIYGIFPYAGADLMMNSYLKDMISKTNRTEAGHPSISSLLLCGVASSSFALTVTYPIGLVRTRLQAGGVDPSIPFFSSPMEVVRDVYEKGGIRAFYRGYLPTIFKVAPSAAISYSVYDYIIKRCT